MKFYIIGLIFFKFLERVYGLNNFIYFYEKFVSVNTDGSSTIIKNLSNISQLKCLNECNKLDDCTFAEADELTCNLYNNTAFNYLEYTGFVLPRLFHKPINKTIKFDLTKNLIGLQNFWPFTNSSYGDIKSRQNISGPTKVQFTTDRFGNIMSALRLNAGYADFPDGMFFKTDFTVTFWLKLYEYKNFTIIEFANYYYFYLFTIFTFPIEKVTFYENLKRVCLKICNKNCSLINNNNNICTDKSLNLNEWNHLGFALKNGIAYAFLNGTIESSVKIPVPDQTIKKFNYLGRTIQNTIYSIVDIDDIKIYNRALAAYEVKYDFEE